MKKWKKRTLTQNFLSYFRRSMSKHQYVMLCMLCILYLKSTHKNSLQKTNKYRLIDATLTPGDQVWSLAVVTTTAATTYSDEV